MNKKVRKLLASVVLGVCLLTLSFIPSFAANSANSASVGNVEAMKECDLANKDIRNGANGTTVTLGITLDGEKYVWTNRRRLSSQQPFENNGDVKVEDVKSLKELKAKYSQCVEERKFSFIFNETRSILQKYR